MFVATRVDEIFSFAVVGQLERPVRSHLKWTHRPGPHRKRRITCAGTNLKNRWAKSCKPERKSNYPATQAEIHDRRAA